jgi:hypothetical protein
MKSESHGRKGKQRCREPTLIRWHVNPGVKNKFHISFILILGGCRMWMVYERKKDNVKKKNN